MSRKREVNHNKKCAHEGCKEVGWFRFDTRREYTEWYKRRGNKPWLCVRHTRPDDVLSAENLKRETVLISEKSKNYPHLPDLFWGGSSVFCYGDGFKAYARDFPEGTKLKITAEIILPDNG